MSEDDIGRYLVLSELITGVVQEVLSGTMKMDRDTWIVKLLYNHWHRWRCGRRRVRVGSSLSTGEVGYPLNNRPRIYTLHEVYSPTGANKPLFHISRS